MANLARYELIESSRKSRGIAYPKRSHIRLLESGFVAGEGIWRDRGALLCNRQRFIKNVTKLLGETPTCPACLKLVNDYNIKMIGGIK